MEKSKKLTAVYALIMDLPLSIIITLIAEALSGSLTLQNTIMNFCLAYVLTFLSTCSYLRRSGDSVLRRNVL